MVSTRLTESNSSLQGLGDYMRELHKAGEELRSEKLRNRSVLSFVWQFMFFWKKHYLDPGKFLDEIVSNSNRSFGNLIVYYMY